ncbi:MAG: hypothetical protein HQL74_03865 [Magnetococcales bacterium]|nr:hypothetical protein [Magnetococcales bacterium]
MPVAQNTVVVANGELAKLTGKTFVVEGVGTKSAVIVPLTGADGKAITTGQKIMLSKNATIEGLAKTGAGKAATGAKTAQMGNIAVVGNKTAAAKAGIVLPKLVEIEGAGKLVGTGQTVGLNGLEIRGVLQPGPNGTEVLFQGGEAKLTIKTAAAKAKAVGATALTKGAGAAGKGTGVLVNQAPTVAAGSVAGSMTGSAAGTTAAKAAAAGTIWKGTGLSLGLGLGLGAWGPVLLVGAVAAAGVGVYSYMKRKA